MSSTLFKLLLIWFILISLVTAAITVADKRKAVKGTFRIPEKTLFILAFSGGGLAEYLTMRLIRHKTLHKRFMIGLPLIIIAQLIILVFIFYTLYST